MKTLIWPFPLSAFTLTAVGAGRGGEKMTAKVDLKRAS
jgi:hypothetical protein